MIPERGHLALIIPHFAARSRLPRGIGIYEYLGARRRKDHSIKHSLIGETTKGFVYYRCHGDACPTTCLREEAVENAVLAEFSRLALTVEERRFLQQELQRMRGDAAGRRQETVAELKLRLAQIDDRIGRLTDAYIDRLIEQYIFEARKKTLLSERLFAEIISTCCKPDLRQDWLTPMSEVGSARGIVSRTIESRSLFARCRVPPLY